MTKFSSLVLLLLLCYGCCTKKKCAGPMLPYIVVKFQGLSSGSEQAIQLYTFEKGKTDSSTIPISEQSRLIYCWPFETPGFNPGRSYLIKWNGKEQGIHNITCDFSKEKAKCNACFPFGDGSETIDTFSNFSFQSGGSTYRQNDTLYINW